MPTGKAPRYKGLVPRIPDPCQGLQVNFCKNPECKNYGIPASADYHNPLAGGKYHRSGGGRRVTGLTCKECDQHNPIKNNAELILERDRLAAYLYDRPKEATCPVGACPNHDVPVSVGRKAYISNGHTGAGSQVYICRACKKRFCVRTVATHHQRRRDKNKLVFMKLVNHGGLKRICEEGETGGGTLYKKLDFLYKQCVLFAGEIERRFLDGNQVGFHRLYLSTDAQEYTTNWRVHEDRRNVKLTAIGTADNDSGFVFGMHLNFDPDRQQAVAETEAAPDLIKPEAFRKHCRYWLKHDYDLSKARSDKRAKRRVRPTLKPPKTMMERIRYEAKEAGRRYNVERMEEMTGDLQLPLRGVQVKKDYTCFAHYLFLKRLFGDNFGKLRFFFDYDSGLRGACHAAFHKEIEARRVDSAYVVIAYGLTKPTKLALLRDAKKAFEKASKANPTLWESEVKTLLMIEQMAKKESDMFWGDWWVHHPLPDMNEPKKMISVQTNIGGFTPTHLANLMKKASLHGINRFFNIVHKRLQALDRTGASASTQSREYLAYGLYNPIYIVKLLEILRVYYNFVLPVKEWKGRRIAKADRKTPAQHLGIADRAYKVDDILNFMPTPAHRLKDLALSA